MALIAVAAGVYTIIAFSRAVLNINNSNKVKMGFKTCRVYLMMPVVVHSKW